MLDLSNPSPSKILSRPFIRDSSPRKLQNTVTNFPSFFERPDGLITKKFIRPAVAELQETG
jgi:hypothetical protein